MRWMAGVLALSLLGQIGLARPADRDATRSEVPVSITSDEFRARKDTSTAIFSGHVRCVQGELIIQSDKLTITYAGKDDPEAKTGDIQRMVFSGSVSIQQKDRQGHCGRAEYDRIKERILCTGDPWVAESGNRIRGKSIEYFLDRNEVRIQRPKAVIRLPEKNKAQEARGR